MTNTGYRGASSNTDFNPHHREGGDICMLTALLYSHNFNPHHREGGDPGNPVDELEFKISIHTTAKVVTHWHWPENGMKGISIHTTAKVVTNDILINLIAVFISIHTTAKVVTLPYCLRW